MKNLYLIGVSMLFCILPLHLFAYNNLTVVNPDNTWNDGPGTIEEATISVTPKGIYTEVSLIMVLSDQSVNLNTNELEIVLDFDLPKDAFITDSWLWVEGEIVKGEMLDRWSATTIYEEIVDRNMDPSVLFKDSETQYQLRVFPLFAGESRKVKITYMVPGNWTADKVYLPLPTGILNSSHNPLSEININTYLDETWNNPSILEASNNEFAPGTLPNSMVMTLPYPYGVQALTYAIDAPLNNGVYAAKWNDTDESIYEIVVMPSTLVDLDVRNRVTVLLDYQVGNSTSDQEQILALVRNQLKSQLNSTDYFNLIFSKPTPYRISDEWLPASEIDAVFDNLPEDNYWASYSNLPALLDNGINFVEEQNLGGSLLLISNSDNFNSFESSNQFLDDLLAGVDNIPVNVYDYQDQNYQNIFGSGLYFSGNEYLYTNLTQLTAGNLISTLDGNSLEFGLGTLLTNSNAAVSTFDFYTTLDDGFTYARYDINASDVLNFNKPLMQVGKYDGNFPLSMELSGIYQSEFFATTATIEESMIHNIDSTALTIWTGQHLQHLESLPETNAQILEIINISKEERVLSRYTTLICLEPSLGGEFCEECIDDSDIVDDATQTSVASLSKEASFTAFPNPFMHQITLDFKEITDIVSIEIYDAQGNLIKIFDVNELLNGSLVWDGTNDSGIRLGSGVFVVKMITKTGVVTKQIVRL